MLMAAPMPTPAAAAPAVPRLRVLYLTREAHPCTRPDVQVLFGRELPLLDVQVDLVAVGDSDADWTAGERHVFPARGRIQRLLAHGRLAMALPKLVEQGVDLVLARDLFWLAAWASWLAHRRGKPFAYWMSLPFPQFMIGRRHELFRWSRGPLAWAQGARWLLKGLVSRALLHRVVLPGADHVFAQSDRMAEYFCGKGVPPDRVTPVPMGVDLNILTEPRAPRPELLQGRRWVGYLGALERTRQPELILQAFAVLRQRVSDVGLLLVGDSQEPADRPWLQGLIVSLGLQSHVLHTGWLAPAEARAHIAGCELALATYPRGEVYDMASPTKIVEYLALGVPALATAHPDQDALLASVGGGLSVAFTPAALAAGMEQMLAEPDRWRMAVVAAAKHLPASRGYPALAALVANRLRVCTSLSGKAPASAFTQERWP